MGEVWRARDTELGSRRRDQAASPNLAHDPDRLARFETEARAVAQLTHPNVLTVFGVGREDGSPYLITELLEGQYTLRDLIAEGPLPLRKAIDYAIQIAEGLAAAHDKGIAHRDLKPANIFVTPDGRVKILDFGLAKSTSDTRKQHHRLETATGVVLGTPGYMAPEQVSGEPADAAPTSSARRDPIRDADRATRIRRRVCRGGDQGNPDPGAVVAIECSAGSRSHHPTLSRKEPGRPVPVCARSRISSSGDLRLAYRRTSRAGRKELAGIGAAPGWIPWILAAGGLAVAAWVLTTSSGSAPSAADSRLRRFSIFRRAAVRRRAAASCAVA